MKQKKLIFLILGCIWIIISFFIIKSTYAKYLSAVDANTNANISSWNIVVNNQDITQNSDLSSVIDLTFPETNYNMANVLVPGGIGYLDLNIDCSNVSVPFQYTVTCSSAEGTEIDDFIIYGYSVSPELQRIFQVDEDHNMATDRIEANVTSKTIRIFIKWNDNPETENLNDIQDTSISLLNQSGKVQVNINFTQLTV